jgi:competence protein ComEA
MLRSLVSLVALGAFTAAAHPMAQSAADSKAALDKPAFVVNLNTATAADLERLPGIGPTAALRIIEYRQKRGPFKKIEELMNVQGVGEKTFLTLKPQITVAPNAQAQPD